MFVWTSPHSPADAPPLILIHGQFGSHEDWLPVLEPLSETHRVFAVDLPGYGRSEKFQGQVTVDTFVEAIRGLGLERPWIAGNSWGGTVAMSYALRYPAAGLILVGSAGFRIYPQADLEIIYRRLGREPLLAMTAREVRALFGPIFAQPSEHTERYLDKQIAMLAREDYPAYVAGLQQTIPLAHETYLLPRATELKVPVLLVWGEEDTRIPVQFGRAAAAAIPGSRLEVLPGIAHVPQIEAPVRFVELVRDFVRG